MSNTSSDANWPAAPDPPACLPAAPACIQPLNDAAAAARCSALLQAEKLHEEEQPKEAQHEENNAQGKQQFDDPKEESEDLKEIKNATESSLTHA